jgi:hypothetical protein
MNFGQIGFFLSITGPSQDILEWPPVPLYRSVRCTRMDGALYYSGVVHLLSTDGAYSDEVSRVQTLMVERM